ncbi:hypothetical protein V6N11_054191 [Hibiscus sabdariffa]|uniref:Uncharacterized protein n=1 Tax=Hibiscus sabdariffa TaxID=183260 RepID=A0ABR2S342_9ROSI
MPNFVAMVGGLGLSKQPKKELQWQAKEICLMDNSEQSELQESPNSPSWIALYLQSNCDLAAFPIGMARLQVLDLSNTNIKALPDSLPNLFALKKPLLRRLQLRVLKVSIYGHTNFKRKQLQSNKVLNPEMISNLSRLIELSIIVDPSDEWWHDSMEEVVKGVCKLVGLRSLCLYLPDCQLLDYISFMYPSLSCFKFTVGHHKRRSISFVPDEVESEFTKWDKCLKFLNGENIPFQIREVLMFSSSFYLDRHENATSLSEFGNGNMQKLKFCLLVERNKMETIIDGDEVDPVSAETSFESLEYLSIYYMKNLRSIWNGPTLSGYMSKLKMLALHTCPKLSNIFSHTVRLYDGVGVDAITRLTHSFIHDSTLLNHPSIWTVEWLLQAKVGYKKRKERDPKMTYAIRTTAATSAATKTSVFESHHR